MLQSDGDVVAGNPGSVTIDTNGTLTGGQYGIKALNYGSGVLSITANGNVTGTYAVGIFALNLHGSSDLSVTTSAVTGGNHGINARNFGNGTLTVEANGNVTGTTATGILARNYNGTDLTVTTGAGTTVDSSNTGIEASNYGKGILSITANGNVTGTKSYGIRARNFGTDLSVTTGPGTTVTADPFGIHARNYGSGVLSITANGNVTGTDATGIYARNFYGTDLSVTTGPGTTVTGGTRGIDARNYGSGALTVTAHGDVTGTTSFGIFAQIRNGTDLAVTTGAGTTVTGGDSGIYARNYGSGALTVTANRDVTGTNRWGILARNRNGTDLTVTTGVNTTVTGGRIGIFGHNYGGGALTITANGDVTGGINDGIYVRNHSSAGTDLTVTTGAGTTVTGRQTGVHANNFGSGVLTITANGDVTGTNIDGIWAQNYYGGPILITVGSASAVTSDGTGFAIKTLRGPSDVTVAGTLNGGAGGAVQFDQGVALDDRLELHPTAVVNGNVLAGPGGTDTLAFGGSGNGTFDLSKIDTTPATPTKQFQDFETFEVDSGIWTFSGATTVAFGVNGGTLMGTGTFGGLTVADGGIVAPGNSIGTMIVNGAFTLNPGAIYEVEVNAAGQSDKVNVKGTVNLTGATLRVLAANGNYNTKTNYTIIDNDGSDAVVGKFTWVTSNLAFLTPMVAYNAGTGNDVVLTLLRNDISFENVAQNANQKEVAKGLGVCPPFDALCLAILNLNAEGARQAFDALSGEVHATIGGVLADDSRYVREAILGRLMQAGHSDGNAQTASLAAAGPQVASLDGQAMALGYGGKSLSVPPPRAPLAFWTRAYGAWADFDSNGNAATADRDLGGFMSGMDAQVSGSWRVGLATGASFSNVDVDARYSSADVESYNLAGYAGGMAGAFAVRGGGTWAWSDIDTSRAVVFPGFFERQNASYDADTGQLFGEVAYPTSMGGMAVEPFAGLAYVSVDTDTFKEHGGRLAWLRGRDTDQAVGYTTLGLRAATTMTWGQTLVTPHISAAWQHAFDDVTPGAAFAFASTGISFEITGVPLAEDSALIDTGLDFALGPNTTAGVSYSGQFGDGVQDNAVKGRFAWLF